MQDRFKFRVWLNKLNRYSKNTDNLLLSEDGNVCEFDTVGCYSEKDVVIQQCTGMKATKGQLLYEGDIVRFFSCSIIDAMSERHPMEERIGQIVWNEEEMKFDVMVGGKAIPSLCKKIDDNNFELIGNIYENPELLEEKK